ncbi:hypothetical protein HYC85_015482 [Camellia sinensis]|uniref:CAAX prenyl protease 2/Lysostaphin resistance protein A-like domain-containing protein n=1 Tax=Camellia sinensis TaxID=4442 RepID=A0A7J7H0I8_CAMSI|nr:hypothetical protein HYC85_015482 [Camellia sinensis]
MLLVYGLGHNLLGWSGSFVLTGLIEAAAIPYLGLQIGELSLDEKAEILFLDQGITTAVVLVVLYSLTNTFQPRPDDLFRYDLREPFDLQKGWLSWAAIGLVGALIAIALTGAALSLFSFYVLVLHNQSFTDALVRLLPLIGSSSISTVCLLGITGVLAPLLEETLFRGFLMVSLTKWYGFFFIFKPRAGQVSNWALSELMGQATGRAVKQTAVGPESRTGLGPRPDLAHPSRRLPTPVSVLISAAVFAVAHLTPGQFPQLFVLGIALGFSYAQTRNLLAPITIHALWNSGVILLLTFLQALAVKLKSKGMISGNCCRPLHRDCAHFFRSDIFIIALQKARN